MNRSSAVMSGHLDRVLGAVDHGQPGVTFGVRRHGPVAEDLPVSLFVVAEQIRGEVVAATVALTAFRIYLYLHCAIPLSVVLVPSAPATRTSRAAHSSSPVACRSGVISALPIASSRQKWARAAGDSPGSSSPRAWASSTRPPSQSPRSPTYSRIGPATSSSRRAATSASTIR